MRRAVAAQWTSGAAVEQGLDLAAQVSATATEALRSRREPALVARRRQRAARRRVKSWSAASAATVAGGAGVVAIAGGVSTGMIIGLVVLTAVLVMCLARAVRAAADLKARTRMVNALPPPSPRRSAVAGELRPAMARLDGYSDGLRRLVGMVGLMGSDDLADRTVRGLRDEVIRAADATELRLRTRAGEASELIRARRRAAADVGGELDATVAALRREIEDGVAGYGRLVTAANEAAHATRGLAQGSATGAVPPGAGPAVPPGTEPAVPPGAGPAPAPAARDSQPALPAGAPELVDSIDQLQALAAGMRELTR
ncbi:MAG TPA: hypothetical protein VIC62_13845 [Nakamurella sp.]|jgi:hypothetical protein